MKPSVLFLSALDIIGIQDLFTNPAASRQPIIPRKGTIKRGDALKALPNSHGKRIACLSGNGCGHTVAESVGICRQCRRAGKRRVVLAEYQVRMISKHL